LKLVFATAKQYTNPDVDNRFEVNPIVADIDVFDDVVAMIDVICGNLVIDVG
jgi:hypothetical protein